MGREIERGIFGMPRLPSQLIPTLNSVIVEPPFVNMSERVQNSALHDALVASLLHGDFVNLLPCG